MIPSPTHTADGDVYEVFARFGAAEPLHQVGTVIAPSPELAAWYAQTLYDEWPWTEMIAVARRELVRPLETAQAEPAQLARYHLYGRKTPVQPLTHLDSIEVPPGGSLKAVTLAYAGEAGWVDLVAFPGSAIVPVVTTRQAGKPPP